MKTFLEYIETFSNSGMDGFVGSTFGLGHSLNLPTPTLDPEIKILKTTIKEIKYNQNPIQIVFDNNQVWTMDKKAWNAFKRSGKEPVIGMPVEMELYPDNKVKHVNVLPFQPPKDNQPQPVTDSNSPSPKYRRINRESPF